MEEAEGSAAAAGARWLVASETGWGLMAEDERGWDSGEEEEELSAAAGAFSLLLLRSLLLVVVILFLLLSLLLSAGDSEGCREGCGHPEHGLTLAYGLQTGADSAHVHHLSDLEEGKDAATDDCIRQEEEQRPAGAAAAPLAVDS